MVAKFEVTAEPRTAKGTGASRRLRRAGKVPAVLYGAGKAPTMVALDHNQMLRNLENEKFHTSILTVTVGPDTDQAILRDCQMHPYKPQIVHVDLQRISATEKIHMRVPLHFINQDIAPGVKQQGGIVSHLMTDVDVTCLPKDLPEYLTVDMGNVSLNQSVHLSHIPLPEGVAITSLAHGGDDLAVATITTIREIEEEVPVAAAVPAEGEAAAAAAAAPGAAVPAVSEAKKPEAGKKAAEAPKKAEVPKKAEASKKEGK